MAGYQQTIIVGNVGRDPNFKYTQGGVAVCDFSVAVTRRKGGKTDETGKKTPQEVTTTWFRVTCWRDQAEIANEYVRKGTQIMVVGTVEVNPYIDKNNAPAATLELTAQTFQLLGTKGSSSSDDDQEPVVTQDALSDIPF